jgi:hypothetical protein
MSGLSRLLRAGRPLRAAVGLLLAIVLVAGGDGLRARGGAEAAGAAGHVEARQQALPAAPRHGRDPVCVMGSARSLPRQGARHRATDLREGGLPAPRAPDGR